MQRAKSQFRIADEVPDNSLSEIKTGLITATAGNKTELLSGFVDRIEADKKRASVDYTFPLFARHGIYSMPPAEFESASPP
jgi:hypothetical protein